MQISENHSCKSFDFIDDKPTQTLCPLKKIVYVLLTIFATPDCMLVALIGT